MSMSLDRETAMLSAQKLRLMQKGNIVVLISLAAILVNAILSLVLALNDPFALMQGGIGTMVVFMLIGVVAMVVGSIMYLVGLYGMGRVRPEYQKAFLIEIVLLILGIVYNMLGKERVLAETVDVIRNLGVLVVLWLVLQGTRCLLDGMEQEAVLRRGQRVWKLYVLSELISVILIFIPVPVGFGTATIVLLAFAVVIGILGIVAAIDYIGYLGQAARALEQMVFSVDHEQA